MAELVWTLLLMLFLIPLAILFVFGILDATVLPGILPPSSRGRQLLRWLGESPWRCAAMVVLGFSLLWFWLRATGG